jgi:hypothetical protein
MYKTLGSIPCIPKKSGGGRYVLLNSFKKKSQNEIENTCVSYVPERDIEALILTMAK